MTGRIRVEVTDQYGTAAATLDPGELHLTPRQRDQLGALAGRLVRDLAGVLGVGEENARQAAVAVLMRMQADEAAYARVAEQKGLLPL
jgi:hypothetical protein